MQSYLIDQNQNRSIENGESVPDRAVSDFRKMIEEKSGEEPEHDHRKPILYAMTACAAGGASCDGDAEIRRCAAVSGENKGADGSSGGKRTGREDTDGGECSGSVSGGRGKHRGKYFGTGKHRNGTGNGK